MFVLDVKDFRNLSDYEIPTNSEIFEEALIEAGVSFEHSPLSLKVRIKDMDARRIMVKAECLHESATAYRMNFYFPAILRSPFLENSADLFVSMMNAEARHLFCHIAQQRYAQQEGIEVTLEDQIAFEGEALDFSQSGKCDVIKLTT